MPASIAGWLKLVEREGWEWREVKGRGGKRGVKRLYKPPEEVLALIQEQESRRSAPEAAPSNTLHTLYKEKGPPSAADQLAALDGAMNGQVKRFAESRPFESNLARLKAATEMAVQLTEGWPGGLPVGIALVFQELLISGDLTERGARRLLEALRERHDQSQNVTGRENKE
jgi:hypothetical protein